MEYRVLGNSGLRISAIGFGCMSLPLEASVAAPLVERAIEGGINFFDTADLYNNGANERLLGRLLKTKRQQLVLATKVGNQLNPDGKSWRWNPGKAYILAAVEHSLQRLQTDYIDLYQLHGGTIDDPIAETIEAFEYLKQQGKIRYYGISSIRPEVIREYVRCSSISSVMMQYSLLDKRPEETCLQLLQQQYIGVLARGSVAKGLLAGKPADAYLDHDEAAVAHAVQEVQTLANAGRTAAQAAVQYVLRAPAIAAAVVGIRTAAQLEDALGAPAAAALTEMEYGQLQRSIPAKVYNQYR